MAQAKFSKATELQTTIDLDEPASADVRLRIVKARSNPAWQVSLELPGAERCEVVTGIAADLVDAEQCEAFAAACVALQSALLRVCGYTSDCPDLKPLPAHIDPPIAQPIIPDEPVDFGEVGEP